MFTQESLFIFSSPIFLLFICIQLWRKRGVKLILLDALFFIYIVVMLSVTMFPIPFQGLDEIGMNEGVKNNFIPFMSIVDILTNERLSFAIKLRQVGGNIVLFIPMGFFAPLLWKGLRKYRKAIVFGFCSSLFIEGAQGFVSLILGFNYKVMDVDDLLLNTLGFIFGFTLFYAFRWGTAKEWE